MQALTLQVAVGLMLMACDDGYLYPDTTMAATEGRVVKMTATIETPTGMWPSNHNLVLAGFKSDEDEVALIVKNLPTGKAGTVEVLLSDIPKEVASVSLCITGRLRNRLYTLCTIDCPDTKDTIRMEVAHTDLTMAGVLKSELFGRRCAGCHGRDGFFGLNLTDGDISHGMVSQPSHGNSDEMLVQPGEPGKSVLYGILTDETTSERWRQYGAAEGLFGGIGYDHVGSVSSSSPELYALLKEWINIAE